MLVSLQRKLRNQTNQRKATTMKRHAITSQYRCTAWAMLLCMLALLPLTATGRETYNFNSQWTVDYTTIDSLKHLGQRQVTLPHAWNEDETFRLSTFEMSTGVVWYRKEFQLPDVTGKRVFIEFEGARQSAEVLLNDRNYWVLPDKAYSGSLTISE